MFCDADLLYQTGKALHLLVTNMKDGQAVTTLERKINLVTIKSISLSNLRDDWLVCCGLLSMFCHLQDYRF